MKYRNKPVEVEALLVQPQYWNLKEIIAFVGEENVCPIEKRPDYTLKIRTPSGGTPVAFGSYIIKDKGDFYVIGREFFEETYEPA